MRLRRFSSFASPRRFGSKPGAQRSQHLAVLDIQHKPQRGLRLIALHGWPDSSSASACCTPMSMRQLEVGPLFERGRRELASISFWSTYHSMPLIPLIVDIGDAEDSGLRRAAPVG